MLYSVPRLLQRKNELSPRTLREAAARKTQARSLSVCACVRVSDPEGSGPLLGKIFLDWPT